MLQATAPGSFSAKFKNLPPIKQPSNGEREYLRPSEVQALMKAAKSVGRNRVRDSAIILLMFRHGLRTAELVALKWSRVDLTSGYLEVRRVKHGHHSVHPLRSPELRALRQLRRDYPDTQYVFVSERKTPLSTRSVRHIVARAGRLAGIEELELKVEFIPINYAMLVAITWRPMDRILGLFKIIWDIEIFSTLFVTLS